MNINLALIIANWALQYGIPAARQIAAILYGKEEPTLDMWNAVFDAAQSKSYEDYVSPIVVTTGGNPPK